MNAARPGRAIPPRQTLTAHPCPQPGGIAGLLADLARTDLQPSPHVNALFARLVTTTMSLPHDHPTLRCPHLVATAQDLCARGEARLESHWAQQITADPATLAKFPYLANYRHLVRHEHQAIRDVLGHPSRHLVFAGSGPLPLTAVLLARLAPRTAITCLDHDHAALRQGQAVADALTPGRNRLQFVHADAAAFDYRDNDAAVIAALVGTTPGSKHAVLTRLAQTLPGHAVLAARSVPADGRRLLYPRIHHHSIPAALNVIGESPPPPSVINSLLMMRRRRPGA